MTGEPSLSSARLWEGLLELNGARRNLFWRMGGKHFVLLCPQLVVEKVAMPQLLSVALHKWPQSLVNYASHQVFTLMVFHGDHCLCQLLAQLYPHLLGCSLRAPCACQREQALRFWEVHPPPLTFPVVFGKQCCVAWFGLHCRLLKRWFVSIRLHTGFRSSTRGRANQSPLAQGLLCWPWEEELGLPHRLHVPFNVGKELWITSLYL